MDITSPRLPDSEETREVAETVRYVEHLVGRRAEIRSAYIQGNARFVEEIDVYG